jgi:ribosome-binding protein aMBF1 (putative translation factor)
MAHQDWNPVVFNSTKHTSTEKKTVGSPYISANKTAQKVEQIVEGDTKLSIKMMNSCAVKAIIKHRCASKLSQKDLATKCCIAEAVIRNIEQGKEAHNPQLLTKIQKVLCVKLLGDNVGESLVDKTTASNTPK